MTMGDAPSRYTAIVGSGTFLPRIALAEHLLRGGDSDGALTLLRWCADRHPGFFGTYHPYLRHGFLRSAGREYMAVLDAEPDAPALRGLAEVAAQRSGRDGSPIFGRGAQVHLRPAR